MQTSASPSPSQQITSYFFSRGEGKLFWAGILAVQLGKLLIILSQPNSLGFTQWFYGFHNYPPYSWMLKCLCGPHQEYMVFPIPYSWAWYEFYAPLTAAGYWVYNLTMLSLDSLVMVFLARRFSQVYVYYAVQFSLWFLIVAPQDYIMWLMILAGQRYLSMLALAIAWKLPLLPPVFDARIWNFILYNPYSLHDPLNWIRYSLIGGAFTLSLVQNLYRRPKFRRGISTVKIGVLQKAVNRVHIHLPSPLITDAHENRRTPSSAPRHRHRTSPRQHSRHIHQLSIDRPGPVRGSPVTSHHRTTSLRGYHPLRGYCTHQDTGQSTARTVGKAPKPPKSLNPLRNLKRVSLLSGLFLLILAGALVPPGHAANPSLVSSTQGTNNVTISVTLGQFIGVTVWATGFSSFSCFTVSDTMGNAYTQVNAGCQGLNSQSDSWWTVAKNTGSITITPGCTPGGCGFSGGTIWADLYTNVATVIGGSGRENCGGSCPTNNGQDALQSGLVAGTGLVAWEPMAVVNQGSGAAVTLTPTSTGNDGISPAPQSQNRCNGATAVEVCTYTSLTNANFPIWRVNYSGSGGSATFADHGIVLLLGGSVSPNGLSTACYGNCGSPAPTFAQTNSTHTVNFNNSVSLFYQFQSNLQGNVVNVTAKVAKPYTNGQTVQLALYSVDPSCTATQNPFTAQCPGFQAAVSQIFTNPAKGIVSFSTNVPAAKGQWFGVSVSGNFGGLDLNDTNTNVNLYQAAGSNPQLISSYSNLGNSKMGLYAFIIGNGVITGPPPVIGGNNCQTATCGLQGFWISLGGDLSAAVVVFIVLFFFILGVFLAIMFKVGMHQSIAPTLPPLMLIVSILLMVMLTAAGIFPVWIPITIILVSAWLFTTSVLWKRHGSSGSDA